jgi:2,4-dienoyl-CoA reductase-like NADH-dependent reductase (Old Yellow Enzyme family)
MQRILDGIWKWSPIPIAVELARAGRKASSDLPWRDGKQITADARMDCKLKRRQRCRSMQEVPPPTELTRQGVDEIRAAFAAVAVRPAHTGFDAVRVHPVHGYLRLLFHLPLAIS